MCAQASHCAKRKARSRQGRWLASSSSGPCHCLVGHRKMLGLEGYSPARAYLRNKSLSIQIFSSFLLLFPKWLSTHYHLLVPQILLL